MRVQGHTAAAKPSTLHQSISSQRLELAVPMSSGYPQAPMQSNGEVFVPAPVTTVVERMLKVSFCSPGRHASAS